MKDPLRFGEYLLLDRIDIGGMAEVFLARGPGGRTCALKRLLPGLVEDPALLSMFLEEARLTAELDHPGVVAIHEVGQCDGSYYIAMEYVAGLDLGAVLGREHGCGRRLPVALSAWVAQQVALALDHAHRRCDAEGRTLGIVHRDVSPRNVLLSFSGAVKLIDFGIALAYGDGHSGDERVLRGKVSYMSPEHARGLPVGCRSDVFALGAILHEMLTGSKLFRGESDLAVLHRIRSAEVPRPSSRNPEVPLALDGVVLRALAREPEGRFPAAADLADALAPFADREGRGTLARFLANSFPEELEEELRRASRTD